MNRTERETREFLRIAERDLGPDRRGLAQGKAIEAAQERRCRALFSAGSDEIRIRLASAVLAFESVAQARYLAPRYARAAADLRRRSFRDAGLRAIASGMAVVAREVAKLRRSNPSFCGFLRRWRAAHWKTSLVHRLERRPYATFAPAVDEGAIRRAFERAIAAQRGLQRRGVPLDEALETASTLLLPPS